MPDLTTSHYLSITQNGLAPTASPKKVVIVGVDVDSRAIESGVMAANEMSGGQGEFVGVTR